MNILVAINRNYITKLEVLLESVFSNNEVDVKIYLLHSELLAEDIERLDNFCNAKTIEDGNLRELHAICVKDHIFDHIVIDIPGLSIETYYRLIAAELLPDDLDRILYLDADIVVNGSLMYFYNIDLKGNAAAVCEDTIANFREDIRTRIGLPKEGTYFNAGVILFHMPEWKKYITKEKVTELLTNGRYYPFHDQDILNILLEGKLLYMPPFLYNFEVVLARDYKEYFEKNVKELKISPIIYHYAGDQCAKPWNQNFNCGDFNKYYWKYAGPMGKYFEKDCDSCENLKLLNEEVVRIQGRYNKFKRYFDATNRWLELEQNGWKVEEYFKQKGYEHIAVYGLGEFGSRLADALSCSNITIDYAIDRKKIENKRIEVKSLQEDELREVDAVVVTPFMVYESVQKVLQARYSCPIISIEEIIYSIKIEKLFEIKKTISFIVPLYKGKKYISDICHMIAKNQENTQEFKLELLIVNDDPENVVTQLDIPIYELDVKIINHIERVGIHGSRLDGLNAADGTYVVFLDQDDQIADDYIKCQMHVIGDYDAVICNGYMTDREYDGPIYPKFGAIEVCMDEWMYMVCDNRVISPGQAVIKKSAIPECWRKHLLKQNGVDDYFLWISMFESGARFQVNDTHLFTHTFNGKNLSSNNDQMQHAMEEFHQLLIETEDIFRSRMLKEFFVKIYAYHIMERKWKWNLWEEDIVGYEEVHKLVEDARARLKQDDI